MRNLIIILFCLVALNCVKDPINVSKTNNENYEVSFLFEFEGCRIYRFHDGGYNRYFSNCRGNTSWIESCGKNCSRSMEVIGDSRYDN
jgi:hypothetical protein